MKKSELKQIIANMDVDVQIVRRDYGTITEVLNDDGYEAQTPELIKRAVDELAGDPYYSRMATSYR